MNINQDRKDPRQKKRWEKAKKDNEEFFDSMNS